MGTDFTFWEQFFAVEVSSCPVLIHPALGYDVKSIPAKELMFPDKIHIFVLVHV